jgi:glutathione peroxidase-family protein
MQPVSSNKVRNNKMSIEKPRARTRKHFWTPTRFVLTFVVLFLIGGLGVSSCNSNDERRAGPVSAPSNSSAGRNAAPTLRNVPAAPAAMTMLPPTVLDAQLKSLSGAPIKLSDYSGKVLLVNLWATWCGPCRSEIPELVKFHKEFHSKGLEMVGLSTENPEGSAQSVQNFVRDFNMDYRVGWATADVAITLMQGRDAIPQSFIISRDGRILKRFVGFNPQATPPQLRQAIEDALSEKNKI